MNAITSHHPPPIRRRLREPRAGGLAISVALPALADAASIGRAALGADAAAPNEINAFLVIDPDGTILIRSPHNEMGQGAITALPMIVAEELECDWSKVKVEYASPDAQSARKQCLRRHGRRPAAAACAPPGRCCCRPAPARACA